MGGTSGWPEFSPADLEAAEGEDGVGIGVRESIMLVGLGVMGCVSWHSASYVVFSEASGKETQQNDRRRFGEDSPLLYVTVNL